jgi:hypothetical protein
MALFADALRACWDRRVITFGAAAGKDHFDRIGGADQRRHF